MSPVGRALIVAVALAVGLGSTGCAQTEREGWEIVRHGDAALSRELEVHPPAKRQVLLARYYEEAVSNPTVRATLADLQRLSPRDRRELVTERITAAGLDSCPLLEGPSARGD